MVKIAPPAKGTLSTKAAPVNKLALPQVIVAAATYSGTRVVGRLFDRTSPIVEHRPGECARPRLAVAPRAIGSTMPTAAAATTPLRPTVPLRSTALPRPREAAPVERSADKTSRAADKVVRVVLIACSKAKRAGKHPARALYQGALFKAALAHAQRIGAEAFVISAKHGLVPLDAELEAYEHKLRPMERTSWGYGVCLALRERMKRRRYAVTIFAGETYAEPLQRLMAALDPTVDVIAPLAGLSLGSQLRWFRVAAALVGGA